MVEMRWLNLMNELIACAEGMGCWMLDVTFKHAPTGAVDYTIL